MLTHVTRTLQDINELQVCKAELEESLVVDEKNCIGVNKEIEECMHQLEVYKYTLKVMCSSRVYYCVRGCCYIFFLLIH